MTDSTQPATTTADVEAFVERARAAARLGLDSAIAERPLAANFEPAEIETLLHTLAQVWTPGSEYDDDMSERQITLANRCHELWAEADRS